MAINNDEDAEEIIKNGDGEPVAFEDSVLLGLRSINDKLEAIAHAAEIVTEEAERNDWKAPKR